MDMEWLISEPAPEYHEKSQQYMSSHQLAMFRKSPYSLWLKRNKNVKQAPNPAFRFGSAVHTLVLEGAKTFYNEWESMDNGPCNAKTGKPYGSTSAPMKEWIASLEATGMTVLPAAEYLRCFDLARSVESHDVASGLLCDGLAEGVVRAEYCETPCQIRIDWLTPKGDIVDLKTCQSLDSFSGDAIRCGYLEQLAFYQAVLELKTDRICDVHIIAVEKDAPHRTGVWKLDQGRLSLAAQTNRDALVSFNYCLQADNWPTGFELTRVLC